MLITSIFLTFSYLVIVKWYLMAKKYKLTFQKQKEKEKRKKMEDFETHFRIVLKTLIIP
jgi:hypothetical protein